MALVFYEAIKCGVGKKQENRLPDIAGMACFGNYLITRSSTLSWSYSRWQQGCLYNKFYHENEAFTPISFLWAGRLHIPFIGSIDPQNQGFWGFSLLRYPILWGTGSSHSQTASDQQAKGLVEVTYQSAWGFDYNGISHFFIEASTKL